MKAGDTIGVATGSLKRVSLLVTVNRITGPTEFEGHVINGAWPFFLDWKTGEAAWKSPTGNQVAHGWRVVYQGPAKGRGHNEIIAYMDDQLARPALLRFLTLQSFKVRKATSSTVQRFLKACRAFQHSWRGTKPDSWDSDIPF